MVKRITKQIPNAVTCLNLLSGCIGVFFAFQGQFQETAWCMLASGLFDFMDGMLARLLKSDSPIGKELDSLADVISFGLLPGVIYFQLFRQTDLLNGHMAFLAFGITAFSALRLAKFNLDERQQTDFIGLNTPMNAFYVLSLPFIAQPYPDLILNPYFLLGSLLLTCWLLVSEIRLFSMKFSSLSWKDNKFRFIFIILGAVLVYLFKFVAIPIVLVLYILFSFIHFKTRL